ncbi:MULTISPECIES: VCBS repeat-containing protein [Micromonospora]|uniref:VCBS repeat-containing protein n=1 Tax=Micromonospora solifontis TaxID=2487138 RepID=A0ABX9W9V6_9ACTN|nr:MULTISPECIES: VCBS repeat-containing protein [Micromonospora]NES16868.1 VCBS repeat-containing protein [Micromonospora sp. PPF5-17B]NES39195.1 VCBS repeat-containing protein [Micromonospora solifontis]NES58934.1 VCBS repeat-containing protein [Micromonospora sp. PPF5-6]RNL90342.1 VCBS repeat-containing protein [Micromonospora solifontis]
MGRSLSAGALATTLALGLLVAPAVPAAAETSAAPREIAVFPAGEPTVPAHEAIIFAGVTGFLHRHDTSATYLWTRYDTGQTVQVPDLAGVPYKLLKSAGGDLVATTAEVPAKPAPDNTVSVLDLSDQSWQQWTAPADYRSLDVYGRTMVAEKWVNYAPVGTELLTFAADGTVASNTPVTLPEGARASSVGGGLVGDLTSAVVSYMVGAETRAGLLDLASARIVEIPGATYPYATGRYWRISGDTVAWSSETNGSGTFQLYSRSGLLSGTDTGARVLRPPYDSFARSAIVGDGLVASRAGEPAIAVPADGGATTTVLPRVDSENTALVQAPDATALVVGGSGAGDWAVRRISALPGRTPTTTSLLPVRDPAKNAGLLYHQGRVRHVQNEVVGTTGRTQYAIYNHPLANGDQVKAGGTAFAKPLVPCAPGVACVRLAEGNGEGVVYVSPGADGAADTLYTFQDAPSSYSSRALTTHNGRVIDVGNRYIVVDDGTSDAQYLVDNAHGDVKQLGSITGAALWFDTLWRSTGTAGQIKAVNLATDTTRTISTGATCVPTELQTSARWLYWSCGTAGPAGVYDLQANRNLSLPAGPVMLGDGFVVRHQNGALQLTDFHDGTVRAPVKLADLAAGTPADDRRVSWAVDRHSGGVAYVDADNAVHVIDTGVPGTPPQAGSQEVTYFFHPRSDQTPWYGSFRLTRPLSGWEMTVSAKWTGEVVHRRTGGTAREFVSDSWDGKLASGKLALNGIYRWTLTGTATGGTAPVTVAAGELLVSCASFGFREMGCDGGASLLGVKSTGEAHWYGTYQTGTVPGRLFDHGYTENWCLSCSGSARTSALVPFGDFDGDALPDLLVRDGNGGMKAYLGNGQLSFGGSRTKSLGAGWMMYRSILAPGDVNSDGHDDILGLDAYGKLWLYTTTGKGGINPRVQVGSGWNI